MVRIRKDDDEIFLFKRDEWNNAGMEEEKGREYTRKRKSKHTQFILIRIYLFNLFICVEVLLNDRRRCRETNCLFEWYANTCMCIDNDTAVEMRIKSQHLQCSESFSCLKCNKKLFVHKFTYTQVIDK